MKIAISLILGFTFMLFIQKDNNEIIGQWTIVEKKNVGIYNGDPYSLINSCFFGPEIWSQAVGKMYEFKQDGIVTTDMAGMDISDKVKIEYSISKEEQRIIFKATPLLKPELEQVEWFVEFKIVDKKTMNWTLNGLTEYKLKKK